MRIDEINDTRSVGMAQVAQSIQTKLLVVMVVEARTTDLLLGEMGKLPSSNFIQRFTASIYGLQGLNLMLSLVPDGPWPA